MRVEQKHLLNWYLASRRDLAWREDRNPYRIWISETMLQQTTVKAVIPYFAKFMDRFPKLSDLAQAKLSEVLEMWSGLGYYSRARNLHKAAQKLAELKSFPQDYRELLNYPGFGPYTARAVASLAFGESVGVLDGNVIRVLTRWLDWDLEWWRPAERRKLQEQADQWVSGADSSQINQALMELGATVCTPTRPACVSCPIQSQCAGFRSGRVAVLPRAKPKRAKEIWLWQAQLYRGPRGIGLSQNPRLPFLKGQWVLPGGAKLVKTKPTRFDVRHSITHHDIYVQVKSKSRARPPRSLRWVKLKDLKKIAPASLIHKILQQAPKVSLGLVILLSLPLLGCRSQAPKELSPALPFAPFVEPESQALTDQGDAFRPQFLSDGKSILFISRQRSDHRGSQAYLLDLVSRRETRLTYQFGDILSITAWPKDSRTIFSSSNDELKEDPWFIQHAQKKFLGSGPELPLAPAWDWFADDYPAELYQGGLKGEVSLRLTRRPGFDGDPSIHPHGSSIVASRRLGDFNQLVLLAPTGQLLRQLTDSKSIHRYPSWHPSGKDLAWVRIKKEGPINKSELLIGPSEAKAKVLNLPPGLHLYPVFHPKGEWLIFSSNLESSSNFNLYIFHLKDECWMPLTQHARADLSPSISPDGETLVYARDSENGWELRLRALSLPPTCAPSPTRLESNQ